jgi:hypothetical protein
MPFTEIRTETADGICTITLHRPEKLNAFLEKRPARFPMRPSADLPPNWPWWPPRRFS